MSETEGHPLIEPEQFVESIRELGLTTRDAINEFVDNSFDAGADNIWITIERNDAGGLRIIIEDDGRGISAENLQPILSFGGKIDRPYQTTGRFGFGLPSSALCQANHTDVYSKTEDQENFMYGRLHIDQLRENFEIPPVEPMSPPDGDFELAATGT